MEMTTNGSRRDLGDCDRDGVEASGGAEMFPFADSVTRSRPAAI